MSQPYRLLGADLSPYSIKVRDVLRFKGLEFEWIPRSAARQTEFAKYARLPLIPVLIGADEEVLQDSTPMIETLERRHPEPSIVPDDPALAFLSELIEDAADEWWNKAMFHYRWSYEPDALSAAHRLASMMLGDDASADRAAVEAAIRQRMVSRLHHVGSSPATAPIIEGSYLRLIDGLQAHLESRSYLFGGRPSLADFGLAGQLMQLSGDPTPGAIMQARAPRVEAWIARMEAATVEGPFESLAALEPTLLPLLRDEIAGCYLPWMAANAAAANASGSVSVALPGGVFDQNAQRYAAKAFVEIRRKRAMLADDPTLARLLGETGCDVFLEPPTSVAAEEEALSASDHHEDTDAEDAAPTIVADAEPEDHEAEPSAAAEEDPVEPDDDERPDQAT